MQGCTLSTSDRTMSYNSTAGTGNDLDLARAVEIREPIQSGHACASLSVLFVSVLSVTVCSLPLSLSLRCRRLCRCRCLHLSF